MNTTIITPTGDRLISFNLCCEWITRQTVKNFQWVVVDDGNISMEPILETFPLVFEYIRREPQPDDPKHTLNLNMLEAFKHVEGDIVLIMEDDEYYHPQYIERMSQHLKHTDLAGSNISRYYHLPSGGLFIDRNNNFCSLSQTGFKSTLFPFVKELLLTDPQYLDYQIWMNATGVIARIFDDSREPLTVGMKSMPGRPGIGIGHKESTYSVFDKDRSILKKWIPLDWQKYLPLINKGVVS